MQDKIAEYRATQYPAELVQQAHAYTDYIFGLGNVMIAKPVIITVAAGEHPLAPPPRAKWAEWLRQGPLVGCVYVGNGPSANDGEVIMLLSKHFTDDYPRFSYRSTFTSKLRFVTSLNNTKPYVISSFLDQARYDALDEGKLRYHKFGPSVGLYPMRIQRDIACLTPTHLTFTSGGSVPFYLWRTDNVWTKQIIHIQLEVEKVGDARFA